MTDLKPHFITVERPYKEGTVEVFEQEISARGVKKAELAITALGVYEAEIDGSKVGDIFLAPVTPIIRRICTFRSMTLQIC